MSNLIYLKVSLSVAQGMQPDSLRTHPTQSIPSFHASVIRYDMHNGRVAHFQALQRDMADLTHATSTLRGLLSCSCRGQSRPCGRPCAILHAPQFLLQVLQSLFYACQTWVAALVLTGNRIGPFFLNRKIIPLNKQDPTLQIFWTQSANYLDDIFQIIYFRKVLIIFRFPFGRIKCYQFFGLTQNYAWFLN